MRNLMVMSVDWSRSEELECNGKSVMKKVDSFGSLMEKVIDKWGGDEEDMEGLLDFDRSKSYDELMKELVVGDFNGELFKVYVGEEWGVICLEESYYKGLKKEINNEYELECYILDDLCKRLN
jgi:hypothetical protein